MAACNLHCHRGSKSMSSSEKPFFVHEEIQGGSTTDTNCSTLTDFDLPIAPSIFTSISGTNLQPETVMSENIDSITSSEQTKYISSRARCFTSNSRYSFCHSSTADSGEIGSITASHNGFMKDSMNNKYFKNIPDSPNKFNKDYKY